MKIKMVVPPLMLLSLMSAEAFADVTCVAQKIIGNQISGVCGSATIPSNSTITTDVNCDVYKVTIACDLYNHAFRLDLAITGPNGENASASQDSDLRLIDSNGNGALVHCSID